jgi:hypothetical protein
VKPLILSWWLLCGADAGTTHYVLKTGGVEVMLPTQNPYVIDGWIASQAYAGAKLFGPKRTKTTTAIGIGLMAWRGFVVAHNAREIVRHAR